MWRLGTDVKPTTMEKKMEIIRYEPKDVSDRIGEARVIRDRAINAAHDAFFNALEGMKHWTITCRLYDGSQFETEDLGIGDTAEEAVAYWLSETDSNWGDYECIGASEVRT